MKLARRVLHEVLALDQNLFRERHLAAAHLGLARMVRGVEPLLVVRGIVVDHELQWIEHAETARRGLVQVVADAAFEKTELGGLLLLRHADPMHELADRRGRVAAPPDPRERRHPRIVPALDVAVVDELLQQALARDHEHHVRARELDLPRPARAVPEVVEEPIVERAVILELERAQRMRRAFDRVGQRVRVVVHRVDAPLVAGALMRNFADSIERRVAQVDVRRRHVDLRAQHALAFLEVAALHAFEQAQVLLDRAVAVRAVPAGLGERAAMLADLLRRQMIDVREPFLDELDGVLVDLREVVGRVPQPVVPVEAEPAHVVLDALDELLGLALGVRVVEAQEAGAAEIVGDSEVDADRFRVADVQIAVRLGRKARLHAPAVLAGGDLVRDDLANEVGAASGLVRVLGFHGRAFSPNAHDLSVAPVARSALLARREARDPVADQA